MEIIIITIIVVRLLVPLTILRWPFWGLVVITIADAFDYTLWYGAGPDTFNTSLYQHMDKFLDTYSYFFMAYVSLGLEEVRPRRILVSLFSWRLFGVIFFELTGIRKILLFTPNLFEPFYVVVFGIKKFASHISINSKKNIAIIFAIITVPKLIHEYILHFLEYPLGIGSAWRLLTNWVGTLKW